MCVKIFPYDTIFAENTLHPFLSLIIALRKYNTYVRKKPLTFGWKGASLMAQILKNLPAMWEIQVQSLGQEDSLEKQMATSSVLAWKISDRGAWQATVRGVAKSRTSLSD